MRPTCGLAVVVLSAATLLTSCAAAAHSAVEPAERAAQISTSGCGHAAGRVGSGVAVGDGVVVTVAHLVVQADEIEVVVDGSDRGSASVIGIDRERDLAALRLDGLSLPPVDTGRLGIGSNGAVVAGSASGTVPFEVNAVVEVSIEEVLGTERHKRLGYEIDASTVRGDSGAGAYSDSGRLIGIVFAFSEDPQVTWLTASTEVVEFLETVEAEATPLACDQDLSRMVPIGT